ncbi:MAG: hypothetical protein M9894_19175 [Planctomycetes bacterium]|nr:hypothetical protein [Planctomycetota bacterium]
MTCADVRAWLDLQGLGLLGDALEPGSDPTPATARARALEHAADCAGCRRRLAALGEAAEVIGRIGLPVDVAAPGRRSPAGAARAAPALGVALAALAVAAGALALGLGLRAGTPPPPADPPRAEEPGGVPPRGIIYYTSLNDDADVQAQTVLPTQLLPVGK